LGVIRSAVHTIVGRTLLLKIISGRDYGNEYKVKSAWSC
jgi:hypothetical protein